MEVEEPGVTLAFVDACYFRKLLAPPLADGRDGARRRPARAEPSGPFWPLRTSAPSVLKSVWLRAASRSVAELP